jgi:hypothetical protein
MSALLDRPELALAAALVVALGWVTLAFWHRLGAMGDEVGARLDALAPATLHETPATDRYARFERRDYSSDRGAVPTGLPPATMRSGGFVVPRWSDFYAETAHRLGDPLAPEC